MRILAIPLSFGLSKPISGGQSRFFNILQQLKNRGNLIVVLESESVLDAADSDIATLYSYKDYEVFGRNLDLLRGFNISFALALLKVLRKERVDLIQLTHPSGALIVRVLSRIIKPGIRVVYDAHNVESEFVNESFANCTRYSRLEKILVPKYVNLSEGIACRHSVDSIISVTNRDKEIFVKKHRINPLVIHALPSCGVEPDVGTIRNRDAIRRGMGIGDDKIVAVFHGLHSHLPNQEAFRLIEDYVAPMFERENERVMFLLGGNGVPAFARKNILSVGFIRNLNEFLTVADVAIVPLIHGAGIKLKVLDYMKHGIPMVVTRKGIEGIEAESANAAIVVDEVNQGFIDALRQLIDDKDMRRTVGENAHKLAESDYSWSKMGERMNNLFDAVTRN